MDLKILFILVPSPFTLTFSVNFFDMFSWGQQSDIVVGEYNDSPAPYTWMSPATRQHSPKIALPLPVGDLSSRIQPIKSSSIVILFLESADKIHDCYVKHLRLYLAPCCEILSLFSWYPTNHHFHYSIELPEYEHTKIASLNMEHH